MATSSTPSVVDAVQSHLEVRSVTLAESSLYGESLTLGRFAAFVGRKQIGRVTGDDYMRFMAALKRGDKTATGRGTPYGANSLSSAAVQLRAFAGYCQSKGWVRVNPFPAGQNGGVVLRGARKRRDYLRLSVAELLTMLDGAEHARDRALLALGMNTGLRCSECVRIKLGDVDLDQGEFYAVISKSGISDRMPITSDLDAELRQWVEAYRAEVGALDEGMYLLPRRSKPLMAGKSEDGRALTVRPLSPALPMTTNSALFVVKRGLLGLGYSEAQIEREGFHTLRRSIARVYFDDLAGEVGYSNALREVAALLHHKNTSTTELYLGLDVERARRDSRMRGKPFLSRIASEQSTPALRSIG